MTNIERGSSVNRVDTPQLDLAKPSFCSQGNRADGSLKGVIFPLDKVEVAKRLNGLSTSFAVAASSSTSPMQAL